MDKLKDLIYSPLRTLYFPSFAKTHLWWWWWWWWWVDRLCSPAHT